MVTYELIIATAALVIVIAAAIITNRWNLL